jgi:glycosyltransferase involved in cell wall biosynthesis
MFGIPFAIPVLTPGNIIRMYHEVKNADVINIHGHPYFASFVYVCFAKLLKKRIVLTQHNTRICSDSAFVNFIYGLFDRTLGMYNLDNSSHIIADSRATESYIREISDNHNITVIYNGVYSSQFSNKISKAILRKKLHIPHKKFICLTVRRITFKNGIDNLLAAARLCTNSDVLFLVGGTGPDLESAQKKISGSGLKNIIFTGYISDADLPSYYCASDVFILPSRKGEGFPIAVLEAMAAGLPVIATKSGGHTEIITNGETGYMVEVQSPEEINNRIETLYADTDLRKHISDTCTKLVREQFTWKTNIQKFIRIIEEDTRYETAK